MPPKSRPGFAHTWVVCLGLDIRTRSTQLLQSILKSLEALPQVRYVYPTKEKRVIRFFIIPSDRTDPKRRATKLIVEQTVRAELARVDRSQIEPDLRHFTTLIIIGRGTNTLSKDDAKQIANTLGSIKSVQRAFEVCAPISGYWVIAIPHSDQLSRLDTWLAMIKTSVVMT